MLYCFSSHGLPWSLRLWVIPQRVSVKRSLVCRSAVFKYFNRYAIWFLPPGFQWGSCYSIFSFMCIFCRSFLVFSPFSFAHCVACPSIYRFWLPPFTDSDYPFGIFKLFSYTDTLYIYHKLIPQNFVWSLMIGRVKDLKTPDLILYGMS